MKIIQSKGLFAMIGEEEKPYVFIDNSEKYRKCLEEIREIAENHKKCFYGCCYDCKYNKECNEQNTECDCSKYHIDKINEVLKEE